MPPGAATLNLQVLGWELLFLRSWACIMHGVCHVPPFAKLEARGQGPQILDETGDVGKPRWRALI
jgi:hypothetical protein